MDYQAPLAAPESSDPILHSYFQIMQLKRQFRRGWLRAGLSRAECESVADHSFGTAMLCLLLAAQAGLDPSRTALMALIHELGEVHAGDIIPHDAVAKSEKQRREHISLENIIQGLAVETADMIRSVWNEYETQSSPTAHFVKSMDSLEMACQATVYQSEGKDGMAEFVASAASRLNGSPWQAFLQALEQPELDS